MTTLGSGKKEYHPDPDKRREAMIEIEKQAELDREFHRNPYGIPTEDQPEMEPQLDPVRHALKPGEQDVDDDRRKELEDEAEERKKAEKKIHEPEKKRGG